MDAKILMLQGAENAVRRPCAYGEQTEEQNIKLEDSGYCRGRVANGLVWLCSILARHVGRRKSILVLVNLTPLTVLASHPKRNFIFFRSSEKSPSSNPHFKSMESAAPSAPKPSLKAWLNNLTFAQRLKKETEWRPGATHVPDFRYNKLICRLDDAVPDGPVIGVPLKESLKHASVQISTADAQGNLYVWGTVPVVVAKCGHYLKLNATEVPGTFRVNGSNRRTRDLQTIFEKPPDFGRKLNWASETYTTHDVASVFRRYLTHLPEPVIPHGMYHSFRDALARPNYSENDVIAKYQRLIKQMPRPNQHLLLYVLDLLSVFAQKSDKNLMTASKDPELISVNGAPMSPITEHPLDRPNPRDSIKRSRTMPTRRKGADGEDLPRLLRKQRRVRPTSPPRDKNA
ncbi:hypothetical protein C0993_000109 [Termitomyces sp. T159_Od127]|nr:hypothetical protein C0993_000109 [Termitomyces sp. T159_Od127]